MIFQKASVLHLATVWKVTPAQPNTIYTCTLIKHLVLQAHDCTDAGLNSERERSLWSCLIFFNSQEIMYYKLNYIISYRHPRGLASYIWLWAGLQSMSSDSEQAGRAIVVIWNLGSIMLVVITSIVRHDLCCETNVVADRKRGCCRVLWLEVCWIHYNKLACVIQIVC